MMDIMKKKKRQKISSNRPLPLGEVCCDVMKKSINNITWEFDLNLETTLRDIIYKSGKISAYGISTMKAGKFIKKYFKLDNNEEIKYFCDLLSSVEKEKDYFFTIGTVSEAYSNDASKGDFSGNCMQDTDYMKMLEEEGIEVLCLRKKIENNSETSIMVGRALMWDCCSSYKRQISFLDRIYTTEPFEKTLYYKWAMEKGWYRKKYQNYRDLIIFINPEGETENIEVHYPMDIPKKQIFPFLDTMRYMGEEGLSNNYNYGYPAIALDSSSGGFNYMEDLNTDITIDGEIIEKENDEYDNGMVWCETTQSYEDESECIEDVEGFCYLECDENIHLVSGREITAYYHTESDEIVYSEIEEEWIRRDESIEDVHGDFYSDRNEDIYEIEGKYYHESDINIVFSGDTNSYILKKDAVLIESSPRDIWFHKDSKDIVYVSLKKRFYLLSDVVFYGDEYIPKYIGHMRFDINTNSYHWKNKNTFSSLKI